MSMAANITLFKTHGKQIPTNALWDLLKEVNSMTLHHKKMILCETSIYFMIKGYNALKPKISMFIKSKFVPKH